DVRRDLARTPSNNQGLRFHNGAAQPQRSIISVMLLVPTNERPVKSCDPALLPEGQVQDRDVTVPNQRLRIAPCGGKVERMRNPVSTLPTCCRKDGAHPGITQRIVQVGKPILIFAS